MVKPYYIYGCPVYYIYGQILLHLWVMHFSLSQTSATVEPLHADTTVIGTPLKHAHLCNTETSLQRTLL